MSERRPLSRRECSGVPTRDPVAFFAARCIAEARSVTAVGGETCGITIPRMASSPIVARTFRLTLDLFDAGVRLMRQNLRRRHPEADEQEIDRRLLSWLRERPGAEHGDSTGRPVDIDSRIG